MNSWKEVPHLFANGKFDFMVNNKRLGCGGTVIMGDKFVYAFNKNKDPYDDLVAPPENCTLIARPISDMSDEEKTKSMVSVNLGGKYDTIKELYEDPIDFFVFHLAGRTEVFLYLLSIGVYPFDQNHNDIIWRRENDNEE